MTCGFFSAENTVDISMSFPLPYLSNFSFIYEGKRTFSDLSMLEKYTTLSAKTMLHTVHIIER